MKFSRERQRRWLYPKLAKFMLRVATYRIRRDRRHKPEIGLLIDTCILDLAVTHETLWLQKKEYGIAARVPVYGPTNSSRKHLQASYLTVIAYLASIGVFKLWSSRSLQAERHSHPPGMTSGYGMFDRSLFASLRMENVDGPIPLVYGPRRLGFRSIHDQMKDELIGDPQDPIYKALWALIGPTVGPKGNQDVWHLATAERFGLDYFVTTDRPFLNAVEQLGHKEPLRSLKAKAVSPELLGALLDFRKVPPIALSYEDAEAFVSTEATMPGQKRRGRPRKPKA